MICQDDVDRKRKYSPRFLDQMEKLDHDYELQDRRAVLDW